MFNFQVLNLEMDCKEAEQKLIRAISVSDYTMIN